MDEAGEPLGTKWGMVDVERLEEPTEMWEEGDAYEPVTNRVAKWII